MYYQWIISIHTQTHRKPQKTRVWPWEAAEGSLWNSHFCCNPPLWASAWPPLVFASFKIEPLDLNVLGGGGPSCAPHMLVLHFTLGLLTFTSQVFYFENLYWTSQNEREQFRLWNSAFVVTGLSSNLCECDIVSEARSNSYFLWHRWCIDTEGFYSHMKLAFVKITQLHI